MAQDKLDKIFDKFGDGAHQGQYVTRKELKEVLSELSGNEKPAAPVASVPGARRSIG